MLCGAVQVELFGADVAPDGPRPDGVLETQRHPHPAERFVPSRFVFVSHNQASADPASRKHVPQHCQSWTFAGVDHLLLFGGRTEVSLALDQCFLLNTDTFAWHQVST